MHYDKFIKMWREREQGKMTLISLRNKRHFRVISQPFPNTIYQVLNLGNLSYN